MECMQSNEPIVGQDKYVQSVGAKHGKEAGVTYFNDLKEVFHAKENVVN